MLSFKETELRHLLSARSRTSAGEESRQLLVCLRYTFRNPKIGLVWFRC
jgi:hypothetical protein